MIRKIIVLFFLCIFLEIKIGASLPICNYHEYEINLIQNQVFNAIWQAHRVRPGNLFGPMVLGEKDAAYRRVQHKYTYSQFSQLYHEFISYSVPEGVPILYLGYSQTMDLFLELYNNCINQHSSISARYERGRIFFDKGLYEESMSDIQELISSEQWKEEVIMQKESLLMQGVAQLETHNYDLAIDALSLLIEKDPTNKEALFNRAVAYFEIGDFELALKDYLSSEKSLSVHNDELKVNEAFKDALMAGLLKGANEGIREFVPSLCRSVYGMGECLWIFVQEPLISTTMFCNTCYETSEEMYEYLKTVDMEKLEGIAFEIKQSYNNFKQLSDGEKGTIVGYLIGKYGIDVFAGGTTLKSVSLYKKFKNTNRIANLEALAATNKSKEIVTTAALNSSNNREFFFKDAKIHWDRQNKHVQGKHNYLEGRSIFEHPDAQMLLNKFAGKGKPLVNRAPGNLDYREKVNFGEFIGYHVAEKSGIKTATTWGEIRYSQKGAHIIPAFPE